MKILISSFPFHPSIGGIEEVTWLLAHEFVAHGHTVKIVTMTPSAEADRLPFDVIRRPSPGTLLEAVRWCDVYLQNQISLHFAWPLLLARRPWVVAHLHPLGGDDILSRVRRWSKLAIMRRSNRGVSCRPAEGTLRWSPIPIATRTFVLSSRSARATSSFWAVSSPTRDCPC